jgi:MFS family permease
LGSNEKVLILREKKQLRFFHGYIVLAAAVAIMTLGWGSNRTFGVFLEPILKEFGWTRAAISAAFTLNILIMGFLSIFSGKLADRFGPRMVAIACGLCLGASYILTSRLQSLPQFYIFYGILGGMGLSGMYAPMMSVAVKWFEKRRALMSGILVAGPSLGIVVLPLISSYLIALIGWRVSYLLLGILVAGGIAGAAFFLRREPAELGLLPYGAGEIQRQEISAGIPGFTFAEAFRTWPFWMMSLASFCDHFLSNTLVVHIVIHAQDLGIPATSAASILSVAAGISIPGRVLMGGIADRIGNRPTLLICIGTGIVGFLILLAATRLGTLYLFAFLFGVSLWAAVGILSPYMAELFGLKAHATLFAFCVFAGSLGSAIGPVTAGYLFDVTGSYHLAFILCLAVSCTSFGAIFLIRPNRRANKVFKKD